MGDWLETQLRDYGVDTKQVDLNAIVDPVPTPELPNLVLGKIDGPSGKNSKTVLVYGHYDVQPVSEVPVLLYFSISKLCIRPSRTMPGRRRTTTLSS